MRLRGHLKYRKPQSEFVDGQIPTPVDWAIDDLPGSWVVICRPAKPDPSLSTILMCVVQAEHKLYDLRASHG